MLATAVIFIGLVLANFYLLAVFLHSDSDVATPGSTYPAHYFTLPVKTVDLVLWPVLSGVVVVGGLTFLVGSAIQRAGFTFDAVTATLVVITVLTTMQAVFWFPIGISYSKLVLSITVIVGIFLITLAPAIWHMNVDVRTILLLLVSAASVGMTWIGVGRARAGGSMVGAIRPSLRVRQAKTDLPGFKSPFRAQVWYEWRHQGRVMPMVAILLFVIFLIPGYWKDTLTPVYWLSTPTGDTAMVSTFLSVYFPMIVVLIPVFAWVVGFGMKRSEVKRDDGSFHLFYSTRPLRDDTMVWAKLGVALKSTMVAWGLIALGCIPILFTAAGRYTNGATTDTAERLLNVLPTYLTPEMLAKGLVFFGVLFFLTWRNLVIGLWTELSGKLALRYLQPCVSAMIFVALVARPQNGNFGWVPYFLSTVVAVKLCIAITTGVELFRRRALRLPALGWIVTGYAATASLLAWAGHYLMVPSAQQPEMVAEGKTPVTSLTIILVCLIITPLARLLLPVWTLSNNRHR